MDDRVWAETWATRWCMATKGHKMSKPTSDNDVELPLCCKDWLPQISILNGMIGNSFKRQGGIPFNFCPWCGHTRTPTAAAPLDAESMRRACVEAIPTSWLDSLLSGSDGLGKPPWNGPDIERLLRAVKARLESIEIPQAAAVPLEVHCWRCAGDLQFGPSLRSIHVILDRFPSDHLLRKTGTDTAPVSRQIMAHEVLAARIELALLEKALKESFDLRLRKVKGVVW